METPASVPNETAIAEKLRATQPWIRLIGILMLIGTVIIILCAVTVGAIGLFQLATGEDTRREGGMFVVGAFLYILLSLLYLYPALLLLRAARQIRTLAETGDRNCIVEALEAQRRFWKYTGICAIVFMVLYAIAIVLAIMLPALSAIQQAAAQQG